MSVGQEDSAIEPGVVASVQQGADVAHGAPPADGAAPQPATGADATGAGPGEPGRDPRVDDALSRLAELEQLPLAEQVEVYADIHRRLAAVLSDPDSRAQ